jgi:hypothetical protein
MDFNLENILNGSPEENWQGAMQRFYNAVNVQTTALDTVIAFVAAGGILKEWYGKLYMQMHLKEILMHSMGGGNQDEYMNRLIFEGMQEAIAEPNIRKLLHSRCVSGYDQDNAVARVECGMQRNGFVKCPACETGYPIIDGFSYKICAMCGSRL